MPVSVTAAASAMAWPRSRTRTSACSGVEHPGERGGGELADAVPGDDAGRDPRAAADSEAGGDQQRLRDGGVADLVRVGGGAVVGQVEPDGVGPGGQAVGQRREFEPGSQEAGRLGALAGSDEDEHESSLPCRSSTRGEDPDELCPHYFVETLQREFRAGYVRTRQVTVVSDSRPRMSATCRVKAERPSVGWYPVNSVI